jgi:hypothetical protein
MRDEFYQKAKIRLSMKSGMTCSNPNCRIFTGGPDENIGVAAHITAASPDGPRYDPVLSVKQRRSYENGIWLCQDCAKLVDNRVYEAQYPITLLRLWRQIAERRASAYVGKTSPFLSDYRPVSKEHGRLLELASATNNYQFFKNIVDHPYTYSTTSTVKDQVAAHQSPTTVLDWATEIIISCWEEEDTELLGICAVLISTSLYQWHPSKEALKKLKALCEHELSVADHTRIGVIEPLVFAIGAKGDIDTYIRFLSVSVEETDWRRAEDDRSDYYYGSKGDKAVAMARHLRDPNRTGILRANDVGRLLTLITKPTFDLSRHRVRELLKGLLRESVRELNTAGQRDLANSAIKFLQSYGINLEPG